MLAVFCIQISLHFIPATAVIFDFSLKRLTNDCSMTKETSRCLNYQPLLPHTKIGFVVWAGPYRRNRHLSTSSVKMICCDQSRSTVILRRLAYPPEKCSISLAMTDPYGSMKQPIRTIDQAGKMVASANKEVNLSRNDILLQIQSLYLERTATRTGSFEMPNANAWISSPVRVWRIILIHSI